MSRFFVKAPSVNAVRKALGRAPGGVRVVGRYDRETIECRHTMEGQSLGRLWPIVVSRLQKAGLAVIARPGLAPVEEEVRGTRERTVRSGEDPGDGLA